MQLIKERDILKIIEEDEEESNNKVERGRAKMISKEEARMISKLEGEQRAEGRGKSFKLEERGGQRDEVI
jgi:hypothetical protein